MKFLLITAASLLMLSSCTSNALARKYGGSSNIELDPGKKLVNITWKGNQIWTLIRDSKPGEIAERYEFTEHSEYGIIEGRVVIQETKAFVPQASHYDTSTKTNTFVVN
jgi:hypothetical protein